MRSQQNTTSSAVTGVPSDQRQGLSVTRKRVLPSRGSMLAASEFSASMVAFWLTQTSGLNSSTAACRLVAAGPSSGFRLVGAAGSPWPISLGITAVPQGLAMAVAAASVTQAMRARKKAAPFSAAIPVGEVGIRSAP